MHAPVVVNPLTGELIWTSHGPEEGHVPHRPSALRYGYDGGAVSLEYSHHALDRELWSGSEWEAMPEDLTRELPMRRPRYAPGSSVGYAPAPPRISWESRLAQIVSAPPPPSALRMGTMAPPDEQPLPASSYRVRESWAARLAGIITAPSAPPAAHVPIAPSPDAPPPPSSARDTREASEARLAAILATPQARSGARARPGAHSERASSPPSSRRGRTPLQNPFASSASPQPQPPQPPTAADSPARAGTARPGLLRRVDGSSPPRPGARDRSASSAEPSDDDGGARRSQWGAVVPVVQGSAAARRTPRHATGAARGAAAGGAAAGASSSDEDGAAIAREARSLHMERALERLGWAMGSPAETTARALLALRRWTQWLPWRVFASWRAVRYARLARLERAARAWARSNAHRALRSWHARASARATAWRVLRAALSALRRPRLGRALRTWRAARRARSSTLGLGRAVARRVQQRARERALERWRARCRRADGSRTAALCDAHARTVRLLCSFCRWELRMQRARLQAAHGTAVTLVGAGARGHALLARSASRPPRALVLAPAVGSARALNAPASRCHDVRAAAAGISPPYARPHAREFERYLALLGSRGEAEGRGAGSACAVHAAPSRGVVSHTLVTSAEQTRRFEFDTPEGLPLPAGGWRVQAAMAHARLSDNTRRM